MDDKVKERLTHWIPFATSQIAFYLGFIVFPYLSLMFLATYSNMGLELPTVSKIATSFWRNEWIYYIIEIIALSVGIWGSVRGKGLTKLFIDQTILILGIGSCIFHLYGLYLPITGITLSIGS